MLTGLANLLIQTLPVSTHQQIRRKSVVIPAQPLVFRQLLLRIFPGKHGGRERIGFECGEGGRDVGGLKRINQPLCQRLVDFIALRGRILTACIRRVGQNHANQASPLVPEKMPVHFRILLRAQFARKPYLEQALLTFRQACVPHANDGLLASALLQTLQRLLQHLSYRLGLNGLEQIGKHAQFDGLMRILKFRIGADKDHQRIGHPLMDALGQIQAGHMRHADVRKNNLRRLNSKGLQRLLRVSERQHLRLRPQGDD